MRSFRTSSGASASIAEVSSLAGMDFRHGSACHRADQGAEMQRRDIQSEIAAQFAAERFENAAVAAMAVDDQQIARRQGSAISRPRSRR